MTIHICAPAPESVQIVRDLCPTCNLPRRMLVCCYAWYGPSVTCLRCGERWEDGERMERPFARGWRKKSVRQAWKRWVRWKRRTESNAILEGMEDVTLVVTTQTVGLPP